MWRPFFLFLCLLASSPSFAGSATLSWSPPTQNTDGSPLTDLSGYRIYWGCSQSGQYDNSAEIANPSATTFVVDNLPEPATCYFVSTAYNVDGIESSYSNEAAKTFDANVVPPGRPTVGIDWEESQSEGPAMTYATRESLTLSTGQSSAAPVIDLPATIDSGDTLVLVLGVRAAAVNTISGWTSIVNAGGSATGLRAFYRKADGTEGATVTGSFDTAGDWSALVYRYSGGADPDVNPPEGAADFADVDETNPDSPNLTPTGGAKDYTWLSVAFHRDNGDATVYPTSYSNTGSIADGSAPNRMAYADRQLNAASENPSAYTMSSADWSAVTIAIHPAPQPLDDSGLVVRYYVDEAASGSTPTDLLDVSGVGTALDLPITYGTNLAYTEVSGNRGLHSDNVAGNGVATTGALSSGNKLFDALDGSLTATLEYVINIDEYSSNGGRVFGLMNGTTGNGTFLMTGAGTTEPGTSNSEIRLNGATASPQFGTRIGRHVIHVVHDGDAADANDRNRLYVDGVLIPSTNTPAAGETINFSDTRLVVMNRGSQNRGFEGTFFYGAIYDVAFDATRASDHYDVLMSDDDEPAGGTTLVVNDAAQTIAADSVALTQANTLAVASADQAVAADGITLTLAASLVVQETLQAIAADGVALTQAHVLAVEAAAQAIAADGLALTQAAALAVADVDQAVTAESVSLSMSIALAVAEATQAVAVGSLALTQAHVLAVASVSQALAADGLTLSTAGALAVNDALQAIEAASPALLQGNVLTISDTLQAIAVDVPALTQAGVLTVADALQSVAVGSVALSQGVSLAVADANQVIAADGVALTQANVLAIASAVQAVTAAGIELTQSSTLVVSDALLAMLVDSMRLNQGGLVRDLFFELRGRNRVFVMNRRDKVFVIAAANRRNN